MEAIKKILRTPSAFVLLLVAIVSLIGVVIKSKSDETIARIPIDATSTAEARLTQRANITPTLLIVVVTETPTFMFTDPMPTETPVPLAINQPTATFAPPATSNTSSASHYYQAGLADFQSRNYASAIPNLNSCVQLDSSFADCYHLLGQAYREVGDYSQSILNHDKAIALSPRYDYYFERGVTYHQKSVVIKPAEYEKAISDFKSCLEINPTFSNCLTRLGMVYRDIGDFAQALIYHNKAIELSPERADFYWERGITYQRMGDIEKAKADFQKARELGYGN